MGLTKEVVNIVENYYKNRGGFLINISSWEEANKVSSAVDNYCKNKRCCNCLANAPVISLGDIQKKLKNSGLFSVGLLGVDGIKNCPAVKDFKKL